MLELPMAGTRPCGNEFAEGRSVRSSGAVVSKFEVRAPSALCGLEGYKLLYDYLECREDKIAVLYIDAHG